MSSFFVHSTLLALSFFIFLFFSPLLHLLVSYFQLFFSYMSSVQLVNLVLCVFFCSLFIFSVLLSIPLHTINFPVLIPVLRLSGGFYCLLYKLCFWVFFPLMVPFSFNLLLLENRYYLKYGLKLRPFREYVCYARYPVTANLRALYQLEGSVISDRKP